MSDSKIQQMVDVLRALMGATNQPVEVAETMLGILSDTKDWSAEELHQLRAIVLPSAE